MKTTTIFSKAFLPLFIATLVLSPVFASAHNDKDEKKANKEEKQAEKIEKRLNKANFLCKVRLFHGRSFSWIREHWNDIDLDNECAKIKKTETPADTVAPVISGILSKTGKTRALILWNTNEASTAKIYYSTTSPVNIESSSSIDSHKRGSRSKNHYVVIGSLATSTTYYAVIETKDKAGNISRSDQFSLVTKSDSTPQDITPPVISSINTLTSSSTIDVTWNTNEPSTSKVYYSTTTPINLSTASFLVNGTLVSSHSLKLENLSTSTQYYLVAESVDAQANIATSTQFSTTTDAL